MATIFRSLSLFVQPNEKERLAYAIEWSIKIVYPVAFTIFCIAYWTHYMAGYTAEPDV
jgi:hypothetical protein